MRIIPKFTYIQKTNPYFDECPDSTKFQKITQLVQHILPPKAKGNSYVLTQEETAFHNTHIIVQIP